MNISYNWIRELTGTVLSPRDLSERLTMAGLAVESIHKAEDDCVLDFDLTSNRPDCLSHLGIAREVAALEGSRVLLPESVPVSTKGGTQPGASVEIQDVDLCPRYAAQIIHGVSIGPSPEWLVKKLEIIGQRAINNVADITNYVLHELGQPLHAFDLSNIQQQKIIVRRARAGEKIITLDGVERALDQEMLVIADATRPIALAGVMGGLDTEISDLTRDVILESAYFSPGSVRRTARTLGLHTEASHRFERGIDPDGVLRAQARAAGLICDIAGGTLSDGASDVYPKPIEPRIVSLRVDRVERLTGLNVSRTEIIRILNALGFQSTGVRQPPAGPGERIYFRVPTWRVDVEIEEDLVEEVARLYGYEKIGAVLPWSDIAGEYHPSERKKRALRGSLQSAGYNEAICFSFIEATDDDAFDRLPELNHDQRTPDGLISLRNPIIEGAARMRSTLLPGLLSSTRLNFNHGSRNVCLFELGRVFAANPAPDRLPIERESLGIVATGDAAMEGRAASERPLDFYDVKGTIEAAADSLNVGPITCRRSEFNHLQRGQQAGICFAGQLIGSMGRLANSLEKKYKFRHAVYVAELDFQTLVDAPEALPLYVPLPRYPSITRDISLVIDKQLELESVLPVVLGQGIESCRSATFVGAFEGRNVPDGKRSLTIRIEYRSDTRTLRDEEVDEMNARIVKALEKQFGAYLRG